jgi:RNA polymerase sigma-70 factor (ECF subfamily)
MGNAPGSPPADFDDTFTRSFGPMVRSLAVACGDREVAADAVQEAFTKAFVRWGRVSRLDDPPGWIRHVALNKIRDHFRKAERGRRAVARLANDTETVVAAPPEPSDLSARLAALPEQQRIAAALFYVEDLSVAEIAHAMHLSDGAVKYHLHAARASLRAAMEPQS